MTIAAHDEGIQYSRRALLSFLASAVYSVGESTTLIFRDEDWYRQRPEREQELTGTLRKAKPTIGPNSRSALRYTFLTSKQSYAVYAPSAIAKFDRLIDRDIFALGKLVDLRPEGFGLEFWIASIRTK